MNNKKQRNSQSEVTLYKIKTTGVTGCTRKFSRFHRSLRKTIDTCARQVSAENITVFRNTTACNMPDMYRGFEEFEFETDYGGRRTTNNICTSTIGTVTSNMTGISKTRKPWNIPVTTTLPYESDLV